MRKKILTIYLARCGVHFVSSKSVLSVRRRGGICYILFPLYIIYQCYIVTRLYIAFLMAIFNGNYSSPYGVYIWENFD